MFRISVIALFLLQIISLSACGPAQNYTDAELVTKAEASLDSQALNEATIHLKNALIKSPSNAKARWLLGKIHIELGNGASAEKELQIALKYGIDQNSISSLLVRAWLLQGKIENVLNYNDIVGLNAKSKGEILATQAEAFLLKGELKEALIRIGSALELQPQSPYVRTKQAIIFRANGKLSEAKNILSGIVASHRKYAPAWVLKGDLSRSEGELEEAVNDYSNALEYAANKIPVLLKRALVRIQLNDLEKARQDIHSLKGYSGTQSGVSYAEGLVHFVEQDYEKALTFFELELKNFKSSVPAEIFAAISHYELKNYEMAWNYGISVFNKTPSYFPIRRLLAVLSVQRERFKDAERLLKPITETEKDVFSMKLMANILLKQGDTEGAIQYLKELADKHNDSTDDGKNHAYINSNEEGELGIIKQWEILTELDPELDLAKINLILSYLDAGSSDLALSKAEEFRDLEPHDALPYALLGLVQHNMGNLTEAANYFGKSLEIKPGDPMANINLAYYAKEKGDYKKARLHYEAILDEIPDHLPALLRLADLEKLEGNKESVEKWLHIAVSKHPNDLSPRFTLANFYLASNEASRAIQILEEVTEPNRRNPELLMLIGLAQLMNGTPEAALKTVTALINQLPLSAKAHYLAAQIKGKLNDTDGVSISLEKSLELDPQFLPARLAYTKLLLLRAEYSKAKESLNVLKKLGEADKNPEIQFLEALILDHEDSAVTAGKLYENVFLQTPTSNSAIAYSKHLQRAGDVLGGENVLIEWINKNPEDILVRQALAASYQERGIIAESLEQHLEILRISPRNWISLNNLAWYLRESDPKRALRYAEKAYEVANESPEVIDTYVTLLTLNGDFMLAERRIEEAVQKFPGNKAILLKKAFVLNKMGKIIEARSVLEYLLDRNPTTSEKEVYLELLKNL